MNFSLSSFLIDIPGLPFMFPKVAVLVSVCKLNTTARGCETTTTKNIKILHN